MNRPIAGRRHAAKEKARLNHATRTTKVVFELINVETRVPKGIAGLFLAGDISGRLRAQDFSTLSPGMAGRSPEKRASSEAYRYFVLPYNDASDSILRHYADAINTYLLRFGEA
jgi:hypothetical protein